MLLNVRVNTSGIIEQDFSMKKKFFIVDMMAMIFRSHYGFGMRPLTRKDGFPTSAIFGSAQFLLKLIEDEKPDYLLIAKDHKSPTFRHDLYPGYKSHRSAMPEDIAKQLDPMDALVKALGIPSLCMPGFEADDLIGTAIHQAPQDTECYIVSGDKDFMQLVTERVFLYSPKKGGLKEILGPNEVMEKMGCRPDQMIGLLALAGDTADNIPGVPGVGNKTAAKLIQEYGTLENLEGQEVRNKKVHKALTENPGLLELSKKLVTICRDVPFQLNWDDLAHSKEKIHRKELAEFLTQMECQKLFERIFPEEPQIPQIPTQRTQILQTLDDIQNFSEPTELFFFFTGEGIGLNTYYLPLKKEGLRISLETATQFLKAIFHNPSIKKITWDLKSQIPQLKSLGLLQPCEDLELLAPKAFTPPVAGFNLPFSLWPLEYQGAFLLRWTEAIEKTFRQNSPHPQDLWIYETIEKPLILCLADMEAKGFLLDQNILAELSFELKEKSKILEQAIFKEAGEEFLILSTKQLQFVLFEKLKIPPSKKTKTGWSTDSQVLEALDHPICGLILDYRETQKLLSTYIETLPGLAKPTTGRVHTRFHSLGAATGRLSSQDPNLQNIPIRTEAGQRIRSAFIAEPGCVILSADYSQIELRLLAQMAGENSLIDSLKKNEDIHRWVAGLILGKSPETVTGGERSWAKAISYGVIYGMGVKKLSLTTGLSPAEAKVFTEKYFESFPKIEEWIQGSKRSAKELGYTQTLWGRRRVLATEDQDGNMAVNSPIQGSAADLIKIAMLNIDREIRSRGLQSSLLLQVHDELVFECPLAEVQQMEELVREGMEGVTYPKKKSGLWDVPLKITLGTGPNWLEAHR